MTTQKFTKMQGCGNDFIIVDYGEFKKAGLNLEDFAKKVCSRNFSVGADGVIVPFLGQSNDVDAEWLFYNSDGSTAQMCGNGMRCFTKYLFDKKYVKTEKMTIRTGSGIIRSEILKDGQVRVNMGYPILEPEKVPFKGKECINAPIKIENNEITVNAVSMGNPHCVIYTDDNVDDLAVGLGPMLEKHEMFPQKTNVEFVNVVSREEIKVGVYERGCGITLACGTGACASVVAGVLNDLLDNRVTVNLPGGKLLVEWDGLKNGYIEPVFLTGPCEYSFVGELYL